MKNEYLKRLRYRTGLGLLLLALALSSTSALFGVTVPKPTNFRVSAVERVKALRDTVPAQEPTQERLPRRLTRAEERELEQLERELAGEDLLAEDREAYSLSLAGLLLSTAGLFVVGLLGPLAGIVLCGMALTRHRRAGKTLRGRGLAITGLVLGIFFTLMSIFLIVLLIVTAGV